MSAQDYKGAANAFLEALKLDPASDEIKTALRQCSCFIVSVKCYFSVISLTDNIIRWSMNV
jgi:hypothetical protein